MCKEYRWVITAASITGAIQSLVWMAFGVVGALLYLCVLPIEPYKDSNDFFRVTLVKLYFEGRNCVPDGSYLGQFDEDYKNEISLFRPELVFGVMVAYVILSAFFFLLSITFYRRRAAPDKRCTALAWSCLNLVICAVDVLFTYAFVMDILELRNYQSKVPENTLPSQMAEVTYIPLAMALLSSRLIAGWLWNFILAFIILTDALCCRNIIRKPSPEKKKVQQPGNRQVEKVKKEAEKPREGEEVTKTTPKYFMTPRPDFLELRESMEATTRFNVQEKPGGPRKESPGQGWPKTPPEGYWHPRPVYGKNWDVENEGYVRDEDPGQPDFHHDLRNFESGQRKIKIVKPPLGKPVGP